MQAFKSYGTPPSPAPSATPPLEGPLIRPQRSDLLVYVAFIFPALAGFLFGYDIGGTSGAVQSLDQLAKTRGAPLGDLENALYTSASLIGATVGSVLVFWIGEPLGRRRELMVGSALYMLGALISSLGDGARTGTVVSGRIIYGLGIALSMHAAPVYISEMAPANKRGLLVSLKEGFIVLGVLMGFAITAIGEATAQATSVYRIVWLPAAFVGLVVVVGMSQMPPSPRWLLLRGAAEGGHGLQPPKAGGETAALFSGGGGSGRHEAAAALRRFRRGAPEEEIQAEIAEIELSLVESTGGGAAAGGWRAQWAEVLRARHALVAGLGLVALQQLTGQPSVMYYQQAIFIDAGFAGAAASAAVIVGAAKLAATLVTVAYVDRFGRRPLLFIGISMMLVALVVLATAFAVGEPSPTEVKQIILPDAWRPVVVIALVVYVCGYQVGFGPISWLIISEVFPIRSRTRALSLAVFTNFAFNLVMTFALEPMQSGFNNLVPGGGQAVLFGLYAALCVFSLFFVNFCVPETKGKTLEEIEEMFTGSS